jgi:hypothetical protein
VKFIIIKYVFHVLLHQKKRNIEIISRIIKNLNPIIFLYKLIRFKITNVL